jgi:hypothetical protein
MAKATWPSDHKSSVVSTGIDWRAASPIAFNAALSVWKRVAQADAIRLRDDPKYTPIFRTLPDEVQCVIHEICEGTQKKQEKAKAQEALDTNKTDILNEIDRAIKDAEDSDDITSKLRGLELKAKMHQLLNPKTQEDLVITINVVTGVDRGAR